MNFRFYRLIFCQCAAALANTALRFVLSLHLLRVTGSAALYGSITALAMLPMLAGAFGGGFLADRFCKHRLLAALDGITAALIAASAFALRTAPAVPVVLFSLCVLYAAQGLYQPILQACLPTMLSGFTVARGNAILQFTDALCELAAPLLVGGILAKVGAQELLLLDAAVFAATAIGRLFLSIPAPAALSSQPPYPHTGFRAVFVSLRHNTPQLFRLAVVLALLNLLVMPAVTVGVPVLIIRHLSLTDAELALAQSVMNTGGLAGNLLAGALAARLSLRRSTASLSAVSGVCAALGVFLLPCFSTSVSYAAILLAAFSLMIVSAPFTVALHSALQCCTLPHLVGRVMSLVTVMVCLPQPAGQALYGFVYERFSAAPFCALFLAAGFSVVLNLALHRLLPSL